ncbi:mycorrhiza-induced NACHT/WD40-repeat domain protein, NWD, partial [Reticulomyxa filosa]
PDGSRIVSDSYDGTIKLWDASSGKLIQSLEGHSYNVNSVQFSSDGNRIVFGSEDETIKLWDASPDKKKRVRTYNNTLELWDESSGKLIQSFEGHSNVVTCIQFSPGGNRIVSGSSDNTIKLWDASSGKLILSLEGHSSTVKSVQFSPDGNRIVSGSYDNTIRLWDISSFIQSLKNHSGD